jgi:hypothetical protein
MVLQVIGAGFGRTGTLSLKLALEVLGFGPCYHMTEVFSDAQAPAFWAAAARGEAVNWDTIFKTYKATVDWPACSYWRELAAHYPQAKVLLSVRDPEKWFESTRRTIFSDDHIGGFLKPDADPDRSAMMEKLYTRTFDGRGHDKAHAIQVFNDHIAEVRAAIAPERLLVYDVKEGWEPLCRFLGVAVPETEFPRANTSDEWVQRHMPGVS